MRCRSGKEFLYADEYVLAYRRSLGFCHRSNRNFEFYQFHPYRNHYQAERICHDGGHRNDEEAADKNGDRRRALLCHSDRSILACGRRPNPACIRRTGALPGIPVRKKGNRGRRIAKRISIRCLPQKRFLLTHVKIML